MRRYHANVSLAAVVASLLFLGSEALAERHLRIRGRTYPFPLAAAKSIEPAIKLLAPTSGAVLTNTGTPLYNPATEEIAVAGLFTALDELALKRKTLKIFINRDNVPALAKLSRRAIRFQGKTYRSGTFAKALVATRDVRWPMRPITAEIVNVNNNKVLARDRVSYYDLRDAGDAQHNAALSTEIIGMSTQLSGRGLGDVNDPNALSGLEVAYLAALPQPNLAGFNSDFTSEVVRIPTYSTSESVEACINYADLDEANFSQELEFGPFAEAMVWANANHTAYEAALDFCDTLPNPGAILACRATAFATFCVHNQPDAEKFELCVDRIEGDVEEGSIAGVSDVSLKFLNSNNSGARARVESDVTLGGVHARVHGRLRNLFVRWNNAACVGRPSFSFNDADIPGKQWLLNWTSCPNLEVDVSSASTLPGTGIPGRFDVRANPDDPELLRATVDQEGIFVPVSPVVNPVSGNCGLSVLAAHVTNMLNDLVSPITNSLTNAWYSGPVAAPEARALTKLLAPYRLGSQDLPGHELDIALVGLASSEEPGMVAYWDTEVNSTVATVLANQRQQFFFQPPGFSALSVDATDHLGSNFDISYNITTGLINRILNTRGASANLHFEFKPTWQELAVLGVPVPAGANPEDNATLNKSTMKKFHSAFKGMGNTPLEILVEPVFDPMVFMVIDPTVGTSIPDVGAPLAYGLENLSVVFKVKDTTVNGRRKKGAVLVRMHVSFLSKGFNFSIDRAISDVYLRPHLDQSEWTGNVVTSRLKHCAMYAHYPGVGRNCERSLEDQVTALVRNRVEQSLTNFVSRIPSPKLFNAMGDSLDPMEFLPQSLRHNAQNITFYGQFRRP